MLRGASAGSFGGASTGSLGGSRGRHDDQVVSQVALAMGRAPGSQGADFQQHQQLLKSRRFYLSAGAAGAPYSKVGFRV